MTQVFISYSRKDLAFVERLAKDLKTAGLEVWYDLSGLEIGAHWGMEIQAAIQKSQYIIIVLSPNSIVSEWVEREFIYASNQKLKVIPLIHKTCDLPLWSVTMHYIDMQGRNYTRHFGELLQVLGVKPDLEISAAEGQEAAAARLAAEERTRLEEQARQKSIAEEKQRLVAEKRLRLEEEKKAHQVALEEEQTRQKSIAEEKSRKEAEERLRQAQEKKARQAALELERSRQETQKRAQWAVEASRLQLEIESALAGEQWGKARQLISQLKQQGPEGRALADGFRKRLPKTRIPVWAWSVPVGVAVIALLAFWARGNLNAGPPSPTANPTATATHIPTSLQTITSTFTFTFTPQVTLIPIFTLTRSATVATTPGIGTTWTRPFDGMVMVYVPAGNFLMGSTDLDPLAQSNEKPQHSVFLYTYWIDKTDVTNAMYALCVKTGTCQASSQSISYTHNSYYGNPQYDNYPVIYVDWTDANAYCSWAGARLPTEAEWEKAARGTVGRNYPWGNAAPTCLLANLKPRYKSACVGDTSAVGSNPSGASPYGALDMAGNVWQWVNDWYSETYYGKSPQSNPQGPVNGTYRVLRGGAWSFMESQVSSAARLWLDPTYSFNYFGFRCARSAP